ncbi:SurA N-terminal domain-containing protein [soil metagenome]
MSVIQTIRDKGAAIVIAVIALSLIGFLLMDAKSGSAKLFGGNNSTVVGEVNGRDIEYEEFIAKEKAMEQQYQNSGSAMRNQIRQNVWDQSVAEKLLEGEFEKLGFAFTPREMSSIMFSEDAPQTLKQAFANPETQQYDVTKAQQWWAEIRKSKDENQLNEVNTQIIDPMRLNTLYSKYASMISASVYTPSWMTSNETEETSGFSNISFVAILYSDISDSTVKVTDGDINDFLKKHKAQYKQEGGRMISYVTFSASPSAQDSAKTLQTVADLKPSLVSDTNAQIFVNRNSSATPFFNGYVPKSAMQMPNKDSIIALADGGVFGPYLDSKYYVIAKKTGTKMLPDSIKCRHILLGTNNPQTGQPLMADSVAKSKIDSIETAIKGGADFTALEAIYSTDQAAHKDKGVMNFDIMTIQGDGFAKEFGDFLLNDNGETRKVVKTQFGWHYIEILDKKNVQPAYKIAYMSREIVPSDETIQVANANATKLSGNARNSESFDKYVSANGLTKVTPPAIIKENDYQIGALQDARPIIRWAFDSKGGDVSEPFLVGSDYVVAIVTKKVSEGLPDAATARPMVEQLVMNRKKAVLIINKLSSATTLEAAAAAYNKPVQSAGADSTLTFKAAMINGIGNEPVFAGAAFNKEYQQKVSPALIGNNGVYVIKVNGFGTKPQDGEAIRTQLERKRAQLAQGIVGMSFNSLKNQANVNDRRSKFF